MCGHEADGAGTEPDYAAADHSIEWARGYLKKYPPNGTAQRETNRWWATDIVRLADRVDELTKALTDFIWLGNNLDNIKKDPVRFRGYYEAALIDAHAALGDDRGREHCSSCGKAIKGWELEPGSGKCNECRT